MQRRATDVISAGAAAAAMAAAAAAAAAEAAAMAAAEAAGWFAHHDSATLSYSVTTSCETNSDIKAKFHYASWFGAGSEPVRSWLEAGSS